MVIQINDDLLVKVPDDIKNPTVNTWSDGLTTLEFYSKTYEMDYDSFEIGVSEEKQRKEITLPREGIYKIIKRIPKKFLHLVDDKKWLYLKIINFK